MNIFSIYTFKGLVKTIIDLFYIRRLKNAACGGGEFSTIFPAENPTSNLINEFVLQPRTSLKKGCLNVIIIFFYMTNIFNT